MPEANQSAGSGSRVPHGQHLSFQKRLGHLILALVHHLPAALIVASLVNIAHHQTHWLDAVDGYAFLTLGNLTAIDSLRGNTRDPKVAVVIVDPQSHEDLYSERSPLDRCELARELDLLYNLASIKVLVIDLDLSPILPSKNERIVAEDNLCQNLLSEVLTRADDNGIPRTTKTIVMEPFSVNNTAGQTSISLWRTQMEQAGIQFGDPSLVVHYGLVTKIECNPDGLAALAFKASGLEVPTNCLGNPQEISKQSPDDPIPLLINPSQYLLGLRSVSATCLSPQQASGPAVTACAPHPTGNLPVVFFGSGYGEDDTYSTPVGTVYGVEVHAAAFLSLLEPRIDEVKIKVLGFLLEIAYAVSLGGIVSLSWRGYYARRFSSNAWKRQVSPYVLLALGGGLLCFVLLATYGSLLLLSSRWSLWLSPIPIAIGMLIESLFNGAVHEAVSEGYEQRQTLLRRLYDAHKVSALQFSRTLAHERRERPRHAHHLKERFRRFMYLDVCRLKKKRKYDAAGLLAFRRFAFLAILTWGICAVLKP